MDTEIKIEAQADYLEKISKSKPINAIAEIIWNALDADAKNVSVRFIGDDICTNEIEIIDDGIGFDYNMAKKTFSALGGSWKRNAEKTKSGRNLHGKEGHGRFKIFTIGHNVQWQVVYEEAGKLYEYQINGRSSQLDKFQITDKILSSKTTTGVTVVITNPLKEYKIFDQEIAVADLTTIYAPYLTNYSDANIKVGNLKLDTKSRIKSVTEIPIEGKILDDNKVEHSFKLDIYEWDGLNIRELHFCDKNGLPLMKYEKQIRGVGDYSYTGYIKSSYFDLLKSSDELDLIELKEEFSPILLQAIKKIKNTFLDRYREDQKSIINKWKEDKVYPFEETENKSPIQEAEEKVFDILALNLNEVIDDFDESSSKNKRLQLKLLRQAIETNPSNIKKIIEEVINLPPEKAAELADLLEYTSLSAIISTSKIISDRLKFISGFEEIVFDVELKKHVKERSQLHRILADNTWFFGDEFFLTVDDQSLTEVLKKYVSKLGSEIVIDKPVLRLDQSVGIVDLMLSKSIPRNRAEEIEFLVVELKAPRVKIGQDEINQIQSYAFAVSSDERFRGLKARWEFWVISNDMDEIAKKLCNQRVYPKGTIFQSNPTEDNDITIKIRTWSEIISENKHKHNFVKSNLDLNISKDDGLAFLQEKYEKQIGSLTTSSS